MRTGAYYSCRRTTSQTDEIAEAENQAVLDSKGNQAVSKQKDYGKDKIDSTHRLKRV